jgi:hypothetical protein
MSILKYQYISMFNYSKKIAMNYRDSQPDQLQTNSRPTPDQLQTNSRPTPDHSRPTPDQLQTTNELKTILCPGKGIE